MNLLKKELNEFFERQLESEIALQEITQQREKALKLANERLLFEFMAMGSFATIISSTVIGSWLKIKSAPLIIAPTVMGAGYFYQKLYGDIAENIKSEAEKVLVNESHLLKPVGGTVTLHEIDERIKRSKDMTK